MMLTSSELIENSFTKYFQKKINFVLNGEIYKKGKFLLLKNYVINNNYFYEFYIEKEKKIDIVKIPFPFNFEEHVDDNIIYFDYRIRSLFPNASKSLQNLIKENEPNSSKLLNSILEIQFE